jgi:hypothetical protein
MRSFLAARMRRMALIKVVLPTPGDAAGPHLADARHLPQALGRLLDHLEHRRDAWMESVMAELRVERLDSVFSFWLIRDVPKLVIIKIRSNSAHL